MARESLFRNTARGREPLACAGESGEHIHYQPHRRVGVGCITSRRPDERPRLTFYEHLAIRLGVTLAEAIRLHQSGRLS